MLPAPPSDALALMPGYEVLCSDDPLWHPRKARSGPSGQTAAAALQALGLPLPPAALSPADLFAARTLDGFMHEEPRARSPRLKTLGLTAQRADATSRRADSASPAATQRLSSRPNAANAALRRSLPEESAPRSTAAVSSRPPFTDWPPRRGEHAAVQEGPLHEAQAACSTAAQGAAEPVGVCRAASIEAPCAQPPPRGPAALQRYNGLSSAEAEALEHVHTAEGAHPACRMTVRLRDVTRYSAMPPCSAHLGLNTQCVAAADVVAFYARFGPDSAVKFFCCRRHAPHKPSPWPHAACHAD